VTTWESGEPVLQTVALTRTYPGVIAVHDVSLTLSAGSVHGLIGHNGAGKSTLVKMLSGSEVPEEGEILFRGRPVHLHTPLAAMDQGIGVVHQHVRLAPNLTVAENFAIIQHGPGLSRADRWAGGQRAREQLARFGIDLDPSVRVGQLSSSMRQLVALARSLVEAGQALILDEPTSTLSPGESSRLFDIVRSLADDGVAVLLVTHRLAEVMQFCDTVTVMRNGEKVITCGTAETDDVELTRMMLGRRLDRVHRPQESAPPTTEPVLFTANVTRRDGAPALSDLPVRRGWIHGLLGLPGSGREEIIDAIVGRQSEFTATTPPRVPKGMIHQVAAMVPSDRLNAGIFGDLDVAANLAVGAVTRVGRGRGIGLSLRSFRKERQAALSRIRQFDVRCDGPRQLMSTLSGGNQQKVVMGRALERDVDVIILDEPTQGVDVGSREDIYRVIFELAASGRAVIVGSQDTEEIARLADRIWIIHDGRHVGVAEPPFDVEALLLMASTGRTVGD